MLIRSGSNTHRYIQFSGNRISGYQTHEKDIPGLISRLGTMFYSAVTAAGITFFLLFIPFARAELPSGYTVVAGTATFQNDGSTMNINASDKAIINYQHFNIGNGNTVNIFSPLSLHRVIGGDPSQILGMLNSTGKVFLINQNGIFFGNNASVNVQGLVASTLNIKNEDFLAGKYVFQRDSSLPAGSIVNNGHINAQQSVALLGGAVQNAGTIQAPQVNIAVGDQMTYIVNPDCTIEVTVDQSLKKKVEGYQAAIQNSGTIAGEKIALQAKLAQSFYESVVNNTGVIKATGLTQDASGKIIAVGQTDTNDAIVQNSGTMQADGGANNANGGSIQFEGDTAINTGSLTATGLTDGLGGTVNMLGHNVINQGSLIDVSGGTGGGTVLLGGDYQGLNPQVRNAFFNYMDGASVIRVNALNQGNGGKVILWADNQTTFGGNIQARGGLLGGNGGFVETSGHNVLQATGLVDAGASAGDSGHWLLDPNNITIQNTGVDTNVSAAGGVYSTTNDSAIVTTGTINASLNAGTDITIQTTSSGANTQAGDITVAAGSTISKTSGGDATLTLKANNSILFNGTSGSNINVSSSSGKLNVVLNADSDQGTTPGGAIALSNTAINSNGGDITLGGGASPATTGAEGTLSNIFGIQLDASNLSSGNGNISLHGTGINNNTNTQHGIYLTNASQITSTDGNITLTGTGGTSTGAANFGVYLNTAQISSTGSGNVSITGFGGDGTSDNHGIDITGAGSGVSVKDGALTLTGRAGNGSGNNFGIYVNGTQVTSNGLGSITLNATGGDGFGSQNYGFYLSSGQVISNTSGDLTINAAGGAGNINNYGVYLEGNPALIQVKDGNLALTAIGGTGTGNYNDGLVLGDQNSGSTSTISSTGTGAISISGYGGSGGTSNNYGIILVKGVVTSQTGNISITGTGGVGGGNTNDGVIFVSGGSITSTGSANISLTGITGTGTSNSIRTLASGGVIGGNTMTGNLTLIGDNLSFDSLGPTLSTAGQLLFKPYTSSTSIGINGGAGTMQLTGALLNEIDTSTVSPSKLIIGDSTSGSGLVTIGNGWDISGYTFPAEVYGGSITTGGITLGGKTLTLNALSSDINVNANSALSKTTGADNTLRFNAYRSILFNGTAGNLITMSSSSNKLNLILNANTQSNAAGGAIDLHYANLDSNDGDITLGGGANPATTAASGTTANQVGVNLYASTLDSGAGNISVRGNGRSNPASNALYGVNLTAGSQITTTSGDISLIGNGAAGVQYNVGVNLDGIGGNAVVSSQTGVITVTGKGGNGSSSYNPGVSLYNGGQINSTSTATITVTGTGGAGTDNNAGISISGTNSQISGKDGNLTITGTGGAGSGSANIGIDVSSDGLITTTGTGNLTITGTGGTGTGGAHGFSMYQAAVTSTGSGDIALTGHKGTGWGSDINTNGTGNVFGSNTMTGDLTLKGDNIYLDGMSIRTGGILSVQTNTNGASIGIGTGAGTAKFDNNVLSSVDSSVTHPSKFIIGNASTGAVNIGGGALDLSGYSSTAIEIDGSSITTDSINAGGNSLCLKAMSGNITLNGGAMLSSTATGNAFVFATGHNFINHSNGSALDTPNGRWLIYAANPWASALGGLSGDTLYNQTFAANPPASIGGTANTLLYASADGTAPAGGGGTGGAGQGGGNISNANLLASEQTPYLLNPIQSPNTVKPHEFSQILNKSIPFLPESEQELSHDFRNPAIKFRFMKNH